MDTFILTLHILACVFLVIVILLQSGKEGMGVIFGGGNSSVFGSSGAGGVLVRLTTILAVIFLCTSLGYNIVTSNGVSKTSIMNKIDINTLEPAKAKPVAPEAVAPATQAPAQ